MEILRNPDFDVLNILGCPTVNFNTEKRLINNRLCYETDEGIVVLNQLTRAIVFLRDDELDKVDNIIDYEFLYRSYFLVDIDFDEWEAFEKVKNNLRMPVDDLYLLHPTSYTIITTTKCNARCGYCYELDLKKKRDMTKETALKIAKYILNSTYIGQPVELAWFGGEPLYNAKVINIICDYLREHDKMFYSSMTTNGYLFDDKLVKKAKYYWNLNHVQITLDGVGEEYNNIKRYIYKNSLSPYKKVINSIKSLLKENIRVEIRMNIDNDNIERHKVLIKELYNIFGNNDLLTLYVYPIFDEEDKRTEEEKKNLYESLCDFEDLIVSYGYRQTKIPSDKICSQQCMCDNGKSVLIGVDGDIGLCEHYPDSEFFSHIDHPLEKDNEKILKWKEYMNTKEVCQYCELLGDCSSLKYCLDFGECTEYKRKWYIKRYTQGLQRYYEDYLKNKNNKI